MVDKPLADTTSGYAERSVPGTHCTMYTNVHNHILGWNTLLGWEVGDFQGEAQPMQCLKMFWEDVLQGVGLDDLVDFTAWQFELFALVYTRT